MGFIIAGLIIAALYSGGMWANLFGHYLLGRLQATAEIEAHTFHLGVCFILSLGFLGIILKTGG